MLIFELCPERLATCWAASDCNVPCDNCHIVYSVYCVVLSLKAYVFWSVKLFSYSSISAVFLLWQCTGSVVQALMMLLQRRLNWWQLLPNRTTSLRHWLESRQFCVAVAVEFLNPGQRVVSDISKHGPSALQYPHQHHSWW